MLKDKDRIFQNLYNDMGVDVDSAKKRGDWLNTKEITDKGVIIPDQIRQREALATVVAYVLKIGPLAYKDHDKFGDGGSWCKEGDWICIGRYAGSRFSLEDMEVRIINDDEVIATILDPDDILAV